MAMLITGLVLFCGGHLLASLMPAQREALRARLGKNGYRGVFSLLVGTGLALIIFGWRSSQPGFVYLPVAELKHPAMLLVVLAFLLFVTSSRYSRLCRMVRHPQLTGVLLWAVAHLLLNGDSRSVLLFGSLGAWALVEMFTINRREGAWVKRDPPGWGAELVTLIIALVAVAAVVFVHPWIAGMPAR